MFRRLFLNTVFSGVAFVLTGLIGLIVIPILVQTYGIALFGLIVLARTLLPNGVFALFDFGFSEVAAQAVARARETGNWSQASNDVSLLLFGAAGVGAILALSLFWSAPFIGDILQVVDGQQESFSNVIRVTGFFLLALFPGLVVDGIVKGFEDYAIIRAAEVFGTLVYAVGATVLAYGGFEYDAVAYVFLGSIFMRYTLLLVVARRLSSRSELRFRKFEFRNVQDAIGRCRQMAAGRFIGVSQNQAPVIVLGALLGPAAVGIYDLLTRLPRFAKSVIALLNSALLPVAARIEASNDVDRMHSIGMWGLMVSSFVAFPPLAAVALFSEPLLRLWIGNGFSSLWGWHALMLLVPAVTVLIGFGATSLLVRTTAVSKINLAVAVQVIVQYVLSVGLIGIWEGQAFIFGQVVAAIVGFPWLMLIIAREQKLPIKEVAQLLLKLGALGAGLAAGYWFVGPVYRVSGWSLLFAYAVMWCGLYWLIAWLTVFNASRRRRLVALVLNRQDRAGAMSGM